MGEKVEGREGKFVVDVINLVGLLAEIQHRNVTNGFKLFGGKFGHKGVFLCWNNYSQGVCNIRA